MRPHRLLWLALLAAACSDRAASPDAAAPVDGTAGCVPSGISEAQATLSTDAAAVTVSAVLRNALEHCAKPEVAFGLVFDTHSFDLLALDIAASARVETSSGAEISADFAWAPGSESSHHRDGVLAAPAPPLDGASWLRLTIADVAGVDRVFEWDETFLVHDLP